MHLHGRSGVHQIDDPPRRNFKLAGGAHRLDDGFALRRYSGRMISQ
jgi:hypothetical protein